MKFALTDDQVAFRDGVRDLLAKEPNDERATWDALVAMGVTTVLVPESDGGLGLDEMTLVPVLEQTGYAALAFPVVETAMVAAPLGLADAGAIVALADGPLVAWADRANVVLGCDGREIPLDLLTPVEAVDPSRPVHRIGRPTTAPAEDVVDRAVLGTAAQLLGLGQAMLDLTVGYVKERRQFGVPVGSFQAVKHHLANGLKDLSFARPAVYRAAYSVATAAATATRDVSMAKAMASDAASFVARVALQCHGAIGYTVEYDLHLWLKRTWALSRAWGDSSWHRERVAGVLGL
jgi:alkylation response protein AidB-like acyl-CoA dehydrogenase